VINDGTPYEGETLMYGVEWGKRWRSAQNLTYHYSWTSSTQL